MAYIFGNIVSSK